MIVRNDKRFTNPLSLVLILDILGITGHFQQLGSNPKSVRPHELGQRRQRELGRDGYQLTHCMFLRIGDILDKQNWKNRCDIVMANYLHAAIWATGSMGYSLYDLRITIAYQVGQREALRPLQELH
jgi:hypothetical protein